MTNVVQIGEFSIRRKKIGGSAEQCDHINILLDDNGGIVKCGDCNESLTPYLVLRGIAAELSKAWDEIDAAKASKS